MDGTECNLKVEAIIDFNIMVLFYKKILLKNFHETSGLGFHDQVHDVYTIAGQEYHPVFAADDIGFPHHQPG